ncbi:hypothetical protein CH354_04535 [Leptospira levettii]|nr:hypothetical protein CH354_04535 [Leptospira levettii]PJZ87357.1 hypothetical protein CH368_17215 [Leptospira levettii]PKA01822.1 hypothetical protein CH369_01105 [Leptospira levettii]
MIINSYEFEATQKTYLTKSFWFQTKIGIKQNSETIEKENQQLFRIIQRSLFIIYLLLYAIRKRFITSIKC